MKYFVVVDVGCIECGEDTKILGIFQSEEDAKKNTKIGKYFIHSHHCVSVYEFDGEVR